MWILMKEVNHGLNPCHLVSKTQIQTPIGIRAIVQRVGDLHEGHVVIPVTHSGCPGDG